MKTSVNRWKWISLAAVSAMILLNILANIIPIGGKTTGEISEIYPSPLTPAPITFTIWAVIYLLLPVLLLYMFIHKDGSAFSIDAGPLLLMTCLANMGWILSWHFGAMTLAMIFMLLLLAGLVMLKNRMRDPDRYRYGRWYLLLPVGLYTGWITVAAVSNISIWLMSLGFNGFGLPGQLLQVIVLLIAGAILTLGILVDRDPYYGLAAIWGYAGILIRHLSADLLNGMYPWTIGAAFLCEAAFTAATVLVVFRNSRLIPCLCSGKQNEYVR